MDTPNPEALISRFHGKKPLTHQGSYWAKKVVEYANEFNKFILVVVHFSYRGRYLEKLLPYYMKEIDKTKRDIILHDKEIIKSFIENYFK